MKPTRQVEYAVGPFPSQQQQVDPVSCYLDKSELETCLHFLVSWNRSQKLPFVLSLSSSHNPIGCCPPNSTTFDTSNTPTSVRSMSRMFLFLFLSTRGILGIHSCSGNLHFHWFFIFHHFDVFTWRSTWFSVITKKSSISSKFNGSVFTAAPVSKFTHSNRLRTTECNKILTSQ